MKSSKSTVILAAMLAITLPYGVPVRPKTEDLEEDYLSPEPSEKEAFKSLDINRSGRPLKHWQKL